MVFLFIYHDSGVLIWIRTAPGPCARAPVATARHANGHGDPLIWPQRCAVSAMNGVAFVVDRTLPLYDLTTIYRLTTLGRGLPPHQTLSIGPRHCVCHVVDPVGTDLHSVVLKPGCHYIVTPDNGTLTLGPSISA